MTCSTRKTIASLLALSLAALAGCQSVNVPPAERLNDQPLVIDDAMQQRDWEPTTAFYQSGATIAGPTGFLYEPVNTMSEPTQGVVETPLFIGQAIAAPIVLLFQPVWTPVIYRGIRQESSYTAVPPPDETDVDYMNRYGGYR
jgi:hypothetical protein